MTTVDEDGELPSELQGEIARLMQTGDAHFEARDFDQALADYHDAWRILPEPKVTWSASAPLLTAIADTFFYVRQFEAVLSTLEFAMRCENGIGNPFMHLRMGQAAFECGDMERAEDELMHVYLVAGAGIFENEDPKYAAFIRDRGGVQ